MTILELKEYIYRNNKIEHILANCGCKHIVYHQEKEYYSATQPDGDNLQGVNIKNNAYLNYRSFTRGVEYKNNKDLIYFVGKIFNKDFKETVKYIHRILGLGYSFKEKKTAKVKIDVLEVFKRYKTSNCFDVREIETLDSSILEEYIPILHIDWLREGICNWTREKYGILYSNKRKRVIIPMRYWLTGELLGVNARTMINDYKELGIKKYFITPTYKKHLNLFGLYENASEIQKKNYVVVYESEKSVLKRDTMGDFTGVALSGHFISDEQISILIGLNVDIVISLDKDISEMEVWSMCEKFYGIRNVYYTIDKDNLLESKDSITDKGDKVFQKLFRERVLYDKKKHDMYLNNTRG